MLHTRFSKPIAGLLTSAACALTINTSFAAIGDATFEAEVDALTHTTQSYGNEIDILESANEDFLLRKELMGNATQFINIYTLAISKDNTGQDTAAQLGAKATLDGVDVNFLYHSLSQLAYASPAIIIAMNSLGVNTKAYIAKNVSITNLYNYLLIGSHKKSLIVDSASYGLETIVGGRNLGDDYFEEIDDAAPGHFIDKWRDTDLLVRGPATYTIQQDFVDSFNRQASTNIGCDSSDINCNYFPAISTENPNANANFRVLHNEPDLQGGKGEFQINAMYKKLLDEAQYSVDIETPYFVPQPELLEALYNALERGVRVRILTNGDGNNDGGDLLYLGSAYYWEELIEAGAEIFLWSIEKSQAEPDVYRQLHSKFVIVDDALFMPGSWNFDGRAYNHENEYTFATTDNNTVVEAVSMWNNDLTTHGVQAINLEWYDATFSWWDEAKMAFYSLFSKFI